MSAASVEQFSSTAIADEVMEGHPGYRVEIVGGNLLVSFPPVAPHARVLTKLMRSFIDAGLDDGDTEVLQSVSVKLPTGAEDYLVPDLAIVDADIDGHHIGRNAYDPLCFRLVVEVTSRNWKDDLKTKAAAYAEAKVPVYVVVDRKHQRLHVLTEPDGGAYANHRVHAPGETVALPDVIGAEVALDVQGIVTAGRRSAS
ncbi:Uma2 family endonuclease [Streptomyces longwoodensis]|uniref:Uma2 family endonuclease n=1 Tax=Streptomyces longwoodensis TaxID=68231 RepID=UPI0022519410|nr:Uma2 family endonuclease [Streptomyces longwoodensis]MCX4995497.1 Uma2 family endonuclease [Streptomyces longwoodensis]